MTLPRILIAGDSYSDPDHLQGDNPYSWVAELIDQDSRVCSVAKAGSSNWEIWKQVKAETWDLAIINLTSLSRVINIDNRRSDGRDIALNREAIREHSKLFAKRITALPNVFVWSPFPDYETFPGVQYKPLLSYNELWVNDPTKSCGNHLTREGHAVMLDWITRIIAERL